MPQDNGYFAVGGFDWNLQFNWYLATCICICICICIWSSISICSCIARNLQFNWYLSICIHICISMLCSNWFAPVLPRISKSTGICLFVFVFVFEAHLICNCIAWNLKFNCILNQICLKILYKVCTGAIPPINNLAIQSNECRFNRILTWSCNHE